MVYEVGKTPKVVVSASYQHSHTRLCFVFLMVNLFLFIPDRHRRPRRYPVRAAQHGGRRPCVAGMHREGNGAAEGQPGPCGKGEIL